MKKKYILLSFDIEDWFQVENLREFFPHSTWDNQELRIEISVNKILELLGEYNVKATFFILGWIAKKRPELIKRISREGHEIASHGFNHILNTKLSLEELEEDILNSKKILEDLTGKKVIGYRAPSFTVMEKLFYILKKLDFVYDSSFNPFSANSRYGKLNHTCDNGFFVHRTGVIELCMPTLKLAKLNLPISGGGYFRLYPEFLFKKMVSSYLKKRDFYIFYLHPWEVDPEQPKVKRVGFITRTRHYLGINTTYEKLRKFISLGTKNPSFDFFTFSTLVQKHIQKQINSNTF